MAHIENAARSGKTKQSADGDGILVPVPNGTYTVTEETLAGGGLDSGEPVFYTRVRIAPAKAKATNEKTSAAKAAKPTKAKAKKGAASTATPGRPKRFELSEGASNKFWAIAHKGSSLHVHYGRIGTEGQSLVKNFPTEAAAAKEQDRLIAEKVRKGYAPCK